MDSKIFITGMPGSGKSSLVMEVLKELRVKAGGIITPEIRESGVREGFKIIDLDTKKEGILSYVDISGPKIGKYGVNLKDLEGIGVKAIKNAVENAEIKLLVMDEVGAMEMISKNFERVVEEALKSDKDCLIVLHRNFVNKYKNRGRLFFLTRENRDEVKQDILEVLSKLNINR